MQTRTKNSWLQLVKMFLITTVAASFTAAVLLLLAAFLLDKLGLNESQVSILVYAVYLLSGIRGAFPCRLPEL